MKPHVLLPRLIEFEHKTRPKRESAGGAVTHFDKRWNPSTGQWEDVDPSMGDYAKGAATVGALGAGYLGHKAIQGAGGYGAVANKATGAVSDFLGQRKAAAVAGAASGRQIGTTIGQNLGTQAGAAIGSATGAVKAVGADALDAIKKKLASLKGLLPKMALNARYQGRLVELAEKIGKARTTA